MLELHFFLCFLLLSFSMLVCFSKLPIESLLFLILCFFVAAGLTCILKVEFLGIIFLMVYVGAVAVLFVFVVMMLATKYDQALGSNVGNSSWLGSYHPLKGLTILFALLFLISLFFYAPDTIYSSLGFNYSDSSVCKPAFLVDHMGHLTVFGQVLWNNYLIYILMGGLLLLVSLISVILLTVDHTKVTRTYTGAKQLSRCEHFVSCFE